MLGYMSMATYIDNRKAHFNYSVEETFEAGIELTGFEVKSIKKGQGSITSAFCIIRGGEAFLVDAYIPPYQASNTPKSYDPYRTRKLLLKKEEVMELYNLEQSKTLTLHPNSLYSTHNLIKCEVAVCKKKDSKDKREDIKKDIARRELRSI